MSAPGPGAVPPPPPREPDLPSEPAAQAHTLPPVPPAPAGTLPAAAGVYGAAAPLYGTSDATADPVGTAFTGGVLAARPAAAPSGPPPTDAHPAGAARAAGSSSGPPGPPSPSGPAPSAAPSPYGTPPAPYGTPTSPYGAPTSPYGTPPAAAPRPGRAALVLGVVALVQAFVPVAGLVAVPVGIAAALVGAAVHRRARRAAPPQPAGRATAGVVVGVVAVVAAFVAQVSYAVVATTQGDAGGGVEVGTDGSAPDDGTLPDDAVVPPWEPLTVVDTAFGPEPDEPGVWWYVAVIENPNPAHRFGSTQMSVEALGADGTLIAAEWEYADALPGQLAVTGSFRDLGDLVVDRVDVRLPLVQRVESAPGVGALSAGQPTARTESWGGVTVEGTVTSTLDEDLASVAVVVVATGPDGQAVAARRGYAEQVPAGGSAPFDATFYTELPAGTTFTAYPSP